MRPAVTCILRAHRDLASCKRTAPPRELRVGDSEVARLGLARASSQQLSGSGSLSRLTQASSSLNREVRPPLTQTRVAHHAAPISEESHIRILLECGGSHRRAHATPQCQTTTERLQPHTSALSAFSNLPRGECGTPHAVHGARQVTAEPGFRRIDRRRGCGAHERARRGYSLADLAFCRCGSALVL